MPTYVMYCKKCDSKETEYDVFSTVADRNKIILHCKDCGSVCKRKICSPPFKFKEKGVNC